MEVALVVGELGEVSYNREEPTENVITWVYEQGGFTPIAKLVNGERFSIVADYLGTPVQAYDSEGELVWERELTIYGGIRKETGTANFVPMRYQGQYFDQETGLCYNRFRYYDDSTGLYLSQDPIRLKGNNPNLYAYVKDTNVWVDPLGLNPLVVRVKELHSKLHGLKQVLTTTAIAEVLEADGTIRHYVAHSDPYLPSEIKKALNEPLEYPVTGIVGHAETSIIEEAAKRNATVIKIAASRPICPTCEPVIKNAGIEALTPFKSEL